MGRNNTNNSKIFNMREQHLNSRTEGDTTPYWAFLSVVSVVVLKVRVARRVSGNTGRCGQCCSVLLLLFLVSLLPGLTFS